MTEPFTLKYNPTTPLVSCGNDAVEFFARRDLLEQSDYDVSILWKLPAAQKIIRRQQDNGSWLYPGGNKKLRHTENYNQLETYRNLGFLVEMYGFDCRSIAIQKAAEYIFAFQTKAGDLRGILGNQYTPYYTAAITELLIKAGYINDPRIHHIFDWFKNIRQSDGGWTIPFRTRKHNLDIISQDISPVEPDRSKPFSHLVTGVVLRAYAAHPEYRLSDEARIAGELLTGALFRRDSYPDRQSQEFWMRFSFPFWFTDLLSACDSLSQLDIDLSNPIFQKALQWFADSQSPDGVWHLKILKNPRRDPDLWISLAICRVLKRLSLLPRF